MDACRPPRSGRYKQKKVGRGPPPSHRLCSEVPTARMKRRPAQPKYAHAAPPARAKATPAPFPPPLSASPDEAKPPKRTKRSRLICFPGRSEADFSASPDEAKRRSGAHRHAAPPRPARRTRAPPTQEPVASAAAFPYLHAPRPKRRRPACRRVRCLRRGARVVEWGGLENR